MYIHYIQEGVINYTEYKMTLTIKIRNIKIKKMHLYAWLEFDFYALISRPSKRNCRVIYKIVSGAGGTWTDSIRFNASPNEWKMCSAGGKKSLRSAFSKHNIAMIAIRNTCGSCHCKIIIVLSSHAILIRLSAQKQWHMYI